MSSKKLTAPEIMSAIATAVYQSTTHTDSNKLNTYDDNDKPYWLSYEDPISSVKCKFKDNKLLIMFTVEIMNSLKLDNHFTNKIDNKLTDVVSSIKSKYKEITGKALGLSKVGDTFEKSVIISNRQQLRTYFSIYTIAGIESKEKENEKDVKDLLKSALDKLEEGVDITIRSK